MTRTWRFIVSAAIVAIHANFALAEPIHLRSGEHGDFTRIVADLEPADAWRVGRTEAGYELRSVDDRATFDWSGVYRRIGHSRISQVGPGKTPGSFEIAVACACHATVTSLASGAVVIDIREGSAPPGSAHEVPIDEQGPAPVAPPGPARSVAVVEPPTSRESTPSATIAGANPIGRTMAERHLPLLWKNPPAAAEPPHAAPSQYPSVAPAHEEPVADLAQVSLGSLPRRAIRSWAGELRPGLPPPTSLRVQESEQELVEQLGRAASQGLIELDLPPRAADRTESAVEVAGGSSASLAEQERDPLAISAETSIDRGTQGYPERLPVTAEGATCIPDTELALAHWADARPAAFQIAEHRATLVAEFDRAQPEAITTLARLYLHFGFGAEARATLSAFGVNGPESSRLAAIAKIIDGDPASSGPAFAGMESCDTAASLWAVLSGPDHAPMLDVNEGAIVRSFSALPVHLRHVIGPELAKRLLQGGNTEAARAIRNALARSAEPGDHDLDLIAAKIDLASDDPSAGQARLKRLASTNAPHSAEALILLLGSRIARGEPVDPALAASAEALAFERSEGADGPILQRLVALARAAGGNFDGAFEALQRWPQERATTLKMSTARELFHVLAKAGNDDTFMRGFLPNRDLFEASAPDLLLRLNVGERLVVAGMAIAARRVLAGEAAHTERGRLLLARADLADFDPASAVAILDGLDGIEVTGLRASASAMIGDHATAAQEFARLGDNESAAREAWRAGDTSGAGPLRGDAIGDSLKQLAAARQSDTQPAGTAVAGPLFQARSLVETSRSTRAALLSLIDATGR